MIDIFSLSVEELAAKIRNAQITSVEVCENYIERISYIENMSDFSSEIVGINKLSKKIMGQFFNFMKIKFKTKRNKFLSWEQVLDMFIVEKKPLITALNKQFSPWVNINTTEDIKKAKRTFSKI